MAMLLTAPDDNVEVVRTGLDNNDATGVPVTAFSAVGDTDNAVFTNKLKADTFCSPYWLYNCPVLVVADFVVGGVITPLACKLS